MSCYLSRSLCSLMISGLCGLHLVHGGGTLSLIASAISSPPAVHSAFLGFILPFPDMELLFGAGSKISSQLLCPGQAGLGSHFWPVLI